MLWSEWACKKLQLCRHIPKYEKALQIHKICKHMHNYMKNAGPPLAAAGLPQRPQDARHRRLHLDRPAPWARLPCLLLRGNF